MPARNCAAAPAPTSSSRPEPGVRILNSRPLEDAAALDTALRARGHEVVAAPLLEIHQLPDAELDLVGVQALLATSANGVRALAARIARGNKARELPLLAVGDATAHCAKDLGFSDVSSAGGDVDDLANLVRRQIVASAGPLLQAAGTAQAGDLAGLLGDAGYELRRAVLYEARTAETLPALAQEALAAGTLDGALFFSPRTARTFVKLVRAAELATSCQDLGAYCLSNAVAEAAGELSWRRIGVAARPEQAALLELIDAGAAG
ncbi:MAG: uroporphyrinogen III synthase [Rhodospirillaceae bacterium]|nr:uroporphyrinogen III synthase [Rhodospirillaceae bacterium]